MTHRNESPVTVLWPIDSGAKAAVLAFSTTDRASFDAIPIWKHKVALSHAVLYTATLSSRTRQHTLNCSLLSCTE